METESEIPDYLPARLHSEFAAIAGELGELGLFTALDTDALARYLLAKQDYLMATQKLNGALAAGELSKAAKWSALQDRFFKQCRLSAGDIGLSLPTRFRLTGCGDDQGDTEEADDLYGD